MRGNATNPRKALAELRAHRSRELSGEEVEARVQASGAAMTDITAAELADMEERARGWLPLQGNRDLAINEERMALDVLDLIDAVRKLAASHETMRGVVEAAIAWSESFGELSKRLPPHVHALRDAVDAYEAAPSSYRAKVQR